MKYDIYFCLVHQSAVKRLENMFAGDNNDGYDARILPSACPLECCANDSKYLCLIKHTIILLK